MWATQPTNSCWRTELFVTCAWGFTGMSKGDGEQSSLHPVLVSGAKGLIILCRTETWLNVKIKQVPHWGAGLACCAVQGAEVSKTLLHCCIRGGEKPSGLIRGIAFDALSLTARNIWDGGDTTASASGTFSAVVHLQPQPAVYSLAQGGYGGGVRVLTEAWTSSR